MDRDVVKFHGFMANMVVSTVVAAREAQSCKEVIEDDALNYVAVEKSSRQMGFRLRNICKLVEDGLIYDWGYKNVVAAITEDCRKKEEIFPDVKTLTAFLPSFLSLKFLISSKKLWTWHFVLKLWTWLFALIPY